MIRSGRLFSYRPIGSAEPGLAINSSGHMLPPPLLTNGISANDILIVSDVEVRGQTAPICGRCLGLMSRTRTLCSKSKSQPTRRSQELFRTIRRRQGLMARTTRKSSRKVFKAANFRCSPARRVTPLLHLVASQSTVAVNNDFLPDKTPSPIDAFESRSDSATAADPR